MRVEIRERWARVALGFVAGIVLAAGAWAQAVDPPVVLNSVYSCAGGDARLVIESCTGSGSDAMCSVQYLNAAAPNGKGARVDIYRSSLEGGQLHGCTLPPGAAAAAQRPTAAPTTSNRPAPSVAQRPTQGGVATAAAAKTAVQAAGGGPCGGGMAAGASIDAMWRGVWFPATLVGCSGGQYTVRYASDGSQETVDGSRVRATQRGGGGGGAGPSGPVRSGRYTCTSFIGVPPNGHMQPMPGIQIVGGTSYVHDTGGSRGSISYDPGQSLVLFHGGNLDGQAARYAVSAQGRATLGIYNERRSRTVIDCDGPS